MEKMVHPFGKKKRNIAKINPDYCTGCGWCSLFCVMGCIDLQEDGTYAVREGSCIGCRSCLKNCFNDAIEIVTPDNKENI